MRKTLTVGYIEDLLRPFSKGTEVELNCGNCHHGSIGSEEIVKLKDNTSQTYGYISLEFNAKSNGNAELNVDKEEWYRGEINKLKEELLLKNELIKNYDSVLKSVQGTVNTNIEVFKKINERKF